MLHTLCAQALIKSTCPHSTAQQPGFWHAPQCSPVSTECPRAHLVQVAVQAVVDDGMEVFQAATMEGVNKVSFSFGLIKFSVDWVEVLDFK